MISRVFFCVFMKKTVEFILNLYDYNNMMNGEKEMSNYSDLTVDQIRSALDSMERNYSLAMDSESYGLANAFLAKIDRLREELVRVIRELDPHTTEADIRFFEGF